MQNKVNGANDIWLSRRLWTRNTYTSRAVEAFLPCCKCNALLTHPFLLRVKIPVHKIFATIDYCNWFVSFVGPVSAVQLTRKYSRCGLIICSDSFFFLVGIGLSKFSTFFYWLLTTHVNWYLWQNTFAVVVCCHTGGHCVNGLHRAWRLHDDVCSVPTLWHRGTVSKIPPNL